MTRNTGQRVVSGREWLRSPEVLAGFREAWRGLPPDYDARASIRDAERYELGRQIAIWMRSEGMARARPTLPTKRMLVRMAAETGLPKIRGVNHD